MIQHKAKTRKTMQEKPSNESTNPAIRSLEARIARTKAAIAALGDMRPGHLSMQMRPSGQGRRPYTQLSYTFQKKGHTDYIRPEDLPRVKAEVAAYRKFKDLCERLVALSIELSKLKSAPRSVPPQS